MSRRLNTRFIAHATIVALALTALLLTAASFLPTPLLFQMLALFAAAPPESTPPPPTILAPSGEMPAAPVGLQEWAQYRGQSYGLVGSGFLLRVGGGRVIGVASAHSVALGDPNHPLTRIAFAVAGEPGYLAEFEALHGPPGVPRTGADMSVDYVLLQLDREVDPSLVLAPDPRGGPQPGERVSLYPGTGDNREGPRPLGGTVLAVEPTGFWVLMDGFYDVGRMSGSPLLSQHTGQVVGMAIAVSPRRTRVVMGFHPIASIVRKADAAVEFPKMADYRR